MRSGLRESFRFAWEGFSYAVTSQRNFRIHLVVSGAVILLGFILNLGAVKMGILFLTITVVLFAEMVNTAIEVTNDVLSGRKFHPRIKIAKDVAVGAVLVCVVSAVAIGILLFFAPLCSLFAAALSGGFGEVRTRVILVVVLFITASVTLIFAFLFGEK